MKVTVTNQNIDKPVDLALPMEKEAYEEKLQSIGANPTTDRSLQAHCAEPYLNGIPITGDDILSLNYLAMDYLCLSDLEKEKFHHYTKNMNLSSVQQLHECLLNLDDAVVYEGYTKLDVGRDLIEALYRELAFEEASKADLPVDERIVTAITNLSTMNAYIEGLEPAYIEDIAEEFLHEPFVYLDDNALTVIRISTVPDKTSFTWEDFSRERMQMLYPSFYDLMREDEWEL